MKLSHLLHHCGLSLTLPEELVLNDITADSRRVEPHTLFIALKGTRHDGATFIPQAIEKGAAAIVTGPATNGEVLSFQENNGRRVPVLHSTEPAIFLAKAAAYLAGPQPQHIVAITGTNGKSSTADFLRQLWQLKGKKAASLGTLGLVTELDLPPIPSLTTPDSVSLAKTLATLKKHGVEHVVLEASSHGLDQHRLDSVGLSAAGFSNLTRDHLDYHETMTHYRAAKTRLFETLLPPHSIAAINADMDTETLTTLHSISARRDLVLRDVGHSATSLRLLESIPTPQGQTLHLSFKGQELPAINLPLPGRFQADNALLAAALCWEDDEDARAVLALLPQLRGVPGRCEYIATLSNGAAAYVDYAHTPDALEHILQSLRPHTQSKLHIILGAGGNRDKGKRPLMGHSAALYADHVIITDDNPRHEDAAAIRTDIIAGIKPEFLPCRPHIEVIGNRYTAIQSAVTQLEEGDVLLVAGKGHEKGQIIGNDTYPFDDRLITKSCMEAHNALKRRTTP